MEKTTKDHTTVVRPQSPTTTRPPTPTPRPSLEVPKLPVEVPKVDMKDPLKGTPLDGML